MGSAWHELSTPHRPAARWAGFLALMLIAACGGDREEAPAAGEETVATADTAAAPAAPAPTATDTAGGAPSPAADTGASGTDPGAKPAPKPAAPPTEKPAPAPKPAQDTTAQAQATPPSQPSPPAAQESPPQTGQETAPAPLRDAYHQAPKDTVDQTTYNGWKQYNLNCARCHGEDVLGTTIAPHLVVSLNTVRTHTKSVYAKLGVGSRRAAVRRAEDLGLLTR